MVMTIVEARVQEKEWPKLEEAFRSASDKLPEGLTNTYLIQDSRDRKAWRILSIWESKEALEKMRSSGETPAAILMFRAAMAEPKVSIFEIIQKKEARI